MTEDILKYINDKDLSESGGKHNQKGIEFQKYWSILRMFELMKNDADDFLLLFEAIQDIAEFDSATKPKSVTIYQIKKSDRKEWTWNKLTGLPETQNNKQNAKYEAFKESIICKLFYSIESFKKLNSIGVFISNSGCDILLESGDNVATSTKSSISELSNQYIEIIAKAIETIYTIPKLNQNLNRIFLERTYLPVDDPKTYCIGYVHNFLNERSPRHSGQAKSLVDALIVSISPLGAKTEKCKSFSEVVQRQGYSKASLLEALSNLQTIPDAIELLDFWLKDLQDSGYSAFDIVKVKLTATNIYKNIVLGNFSTEDQKLIEEIDKFLSTTIKDKKDISYVKRALAIFRPQNPKKTETELIGYLLIRIIIKCVDQN
ncbi:dsDNA nuclease domain-containing protein [Leptospira limi]|uniref:DUF4297 domain-containing protein n=2 Tax=Leptospira TaxID=171 RepID=A0ABT3M201_9LEPT|nr:dsDNA nuclease domain-containing protein [Leptospira limi]MCW7464005.1 DUF4297 domain-containing protein [Leptospira limi]